MLVPPLNCRSSIAMKPEMIIQRLDVRSRIADHPVIVVQEREVGLALRYFAVGPRLYANRGSR